MSRQDFSQRVRGDEGCVVDIVRKVCVCVTVVDHPGLDTKYIKYYIYCMSAVES